MAVSNEKVRGQSLERSRNEGHHEIIKCLSLKGLPFEGR